MKPVKILLFLSLACLISCAPKIKNDKSIGEPEAKTYKLLVDSLLKSFKHQFNGNMYESEKITPIEINGRIRVGIPEGSAYIFDKTDLKFVKGDLNNDKQYDLIISANSTEGRGLEGKKYFVYLQVKGAYVYAAEFKGDEMVFDNCRNNDLKVGVFNLDSIAGGLLVGSADYQGTNEASYRDYSYKSATEKYRFDAKAKSMTLVSKSDLLKKNAQTSEYEKVEKPADKKVVIKEIKL